MNAAAAVCVGGNAEAPEKKNNFNSASPCATHCSLPRRATGSGTSMGVLRI
jgi:hypothetical protein